MWRGDAPVTDELEGGKTDFKNLVILHFKNHKLTQSALDFYCTHYTCVTHTVDELYLGRKQLSNCRETGQDSNQLIRLASHLVISTNSWNRGSEFEPPAWTWTRCSNNIEGLRGSVFYIGEPDVIMSCLTFGKLSVLLRLHNACSCAHHWQTHLPGRLTWRCHSRQYFSIPSAVP